MKLSTLLLSTTAIATNAQSNGGGPGSFNPCLSACHDSADCTWSFPTTEGGSIETRCFCDGHLIAANEVCVEATEHIGEECACADDEFCQELADGTFICYKLNLSNNADACSGCGTGAECHQYYSTHFCTCYGEVVADGEACAIGNGTGSGSR